MKKNLKSGFIGFVAGAVLVTGMAVFAAQMNVVENAFPITLNGEAVNIDGYNINDFTYFKLRDIGDAVGFDVVFQDGVIALTTEAALAEENAPEGEEEIVAPPAEEPDETEIDESADVDDETDFGVDAPEDEIDDADAE